MSRHGQQCGQRNGVATLPGGRDLHCPEWCRDTNLMSRHGASFQEVATWNDVSTWPGAGCLGVSRQVHAQRARDLHWLRARHARDKLVVRAAAPTT